MSETPFQLQKILAPMDFSGHSEAALHCAVAWAKSFHARITLIHVIGSERLTGEFTELGIPVATIPDAVKKRLGALATHSKEESLFDPPEVRIGRPEYEIGFAARELLSDLVVITTHGYTGLDYVLLGGTAEQIIRHTTCPVLVVRRPNGRAPEPKKILVPVGFSAGSLEGLKYGCGLARPFDARVTAVHVVEPFEPAVRLEVNMQLYEKRLFDVAKSRLQELHAEVNEPAGAFETLLQEGTPHAEILETARRGEFDLIVMASLHWTGLGDMFLGRTVEHVLRYAPCPVLIMRGGFSKAAPKALLSEK